MKKILIIALALSLGCSFMACSTKPVEDTGSYLSEALSE